ncbi:class I SAM-dependent methyltransferase [Actinomadura sp. ATCC 31491]|uniref:Class I SAM-dependent methyltransferase n=1 Tax=Actinomadura luzonensis TaxID=2805427 RepID=A0ABT0G672_9ACTN|nr:class I SAM-dependent methyltransferase [Actinomadura luzonensis]MCK2220075.1 class I SAM-dependent methyltransferase [Actinomadura luzonensis]
MTPTRARYDAVADFYASGWPDAIDDPASLRLLTLLEPIAGRRILDLACGHGRITRELARRGAAQVVGVDLSAALLERARAAERDNPLGIHYIHADVTTWSTPDQYDAVTCNFGLSDIDDLDAALATAARALRPGGLFVCSLLHPCFPGGPNVSGSWPSGGRYHDEGWWQATGELSSLRRQVGANHRTLATYLNAIRRQGLWLDELSEPEPSRDWASGRPDAARFPVFLVMRWVKATAQP